MFLPPDKVDQAIQQLTRFLSAPNPRVIDWQKVIGKLCHLSQVVTAGRTYLGSLYGSLQGILSQEGHRRRKISAEAKEDLEVWKGFLQTILPEKGFHMLGGNPDKDFVFSTDASSTVGFGCVMGEKWFCGTWPSDDWRQTNIAVRELYPIFAALHLWVDTFEDKCIHIHTDNHALVAVLNKLYSKDKAIRRILKPIALLCITRNVRLVTHHLAGVLNVGPDLLSRGKVAEFFEKFPDMLPEPAVVPNSLAPAHWIN
jgi:hypothetical protein